MGIVNRCFKTYSSDEIQEILSPLKRWQQQAAIKAAAQMREDFRGLSEIPHNTYLAIIAQHFADAYLNEPDDVHEPTYYAAGDKVIKEGGDYTFEGVVRAAFRKDSGVVRYVVEDDRGLLFIFNAKQLRRA